MNLHGILMVLGFMKVAFDSVMTIAYDTQGDNSLVLVGCPAGLARISMIY
jgi:hypothetical protein